jgi:hypothetical protein
MVDLAREARISSFQKRFQEFKKFEELNNTAIETKWRDIIAVQFNTQQIQSIAKVRANYTKQLDRCDAVVHRLLQWLEGGETQYQFSLRSHKHNLELLWNLASKRINNALQRFTTQMQTFKDEFNQNRAAALTEYRRHTAEVRDITAAIEHEFKLKRAAMDEKFRVENEALTMKSQEAISALRTHLTEETNKALEAQTSANDSFKAKSEGKTQQYLQMFEKDKIRKWKMKVRQEMIIKLAAQIAHWRRKIKNNERESREANNRLRQEKENLSLHFRELKQTMAHFRMLENRKLAEISVLFENSIDSMTDKLKMAEKILKYAEMTRKLETEREHVIPFPVSLVETDPEISRQMQQFKLQLKGDGKYVAESDLFDKFYRRFNKVLLEKLCLQREKEALLQYNMRLKSMMKRYMGGMGVSQDLQNKPNTLFIVNQSTNAPMMKVDQDLIPKIDANLVVAANKLQGY